MVPLTGTKVLPSFPLPLTPPVLETAKVYVWQRFVLGFYHQERTGRCWQEADIIGYISERGRVLQMEITREGKRKDKKEKEGRKTHREEESLKAGPRNLWEAPGPRGRVRSPGLGTSRDLSVWLRLLPARWPCSEWAYPKRERWRVSAPNDPDGGHMPLTISSQKTPLDPSSVLCWPKPPQAHPDSVGGDAEHTSPCMIISTFLVCS